MKLLRVIRSLDPRGGGPREGIRQITPHLAAYGVETTVASLDSPDAPWLADFPARTYALGPVQGGYGYRPGLPRRIQTLAQAHDVVIIHGIWQYHAMATWRALHHSDIPYLVYTHGMLDPWFKHTYPLKHLKKWAYWPWADYRVLRDARAVLFTTEQERLLARESFWLYHAHEQVVNYGISGPDGVPELQRQEFLSRFPELNGKRLLLFLSRIHPKKGTDLLIEAFARICDQDPRLHLVIAGPDQVGWQEALHQRATELQIAERITWTGMLSGDLKWGSFHSAELFCLPSHQENFGIAVAEALACCLPVVIGKPVNIAGEVTAAQVGFVVEDSIDGTVKGMTNWLNLNAETQAQFREQARQLFQSKFEITQSSRNLRGILEKAVSSSFQEAASPALLS